MGKSGLREVFLRTAHTAAPRAGNMELKQAEIFLNDTERLLRDRYAAVTVRFASRGYFADEDPGGTTVTPSKARNGLFVLLEGDDFIISRVTNAFGRTETQSFGKMDFKIAPITFDWKKKSLPGLRLESIVGASLVFGLAEPMAFQAVSMAKLISLRDSYVDMWLPRDLDASPVVGTNDWGQEAEVNETSNVFDTEGSHAGEAVALSGSGEILGEPDAPSSVEADLPFPCSLCQHRFVSSEKLALHTKNFHP